MKMGQFCYAVVLISRITGRVGLSLLRLSVCLYRTGS